jgi:hypothetical protein
MSLPPANPEIIRRARQVLDVQPATARLSLDELERAGLVEKATRQAGMPPEAREAEHQAMTALGDQLMRDVFAVNPDLAEKMRLRNPTLWARLEDPNTVEEEGLAAVAINDLAARRTRKTN